jgi:integrase
MSYRTGSLKYQVNQIFARGHAIGESKHAAKRESDTAGRVFAVRTDWDYRDGALYFARWARERHGCHDVATALHRPDWGHEWAEELAAQGRAASTRKTYFSGVAKACAIVAPSLRSAWTDVITAIGRRTPPPPRGYGADAERMLAAVGEASVEAMLILELALATGARIGELVRTRRGGDHHLVSDRLLGERGLLLVGKGGLQRVVHVPEALYERLERLLRVSAMRIRCSRSSIATSSASCAPPWACRQPVRTGSGTTSPCACVPAFWPMAWRPTRRTARFPYNLAIAGPRSPTTTCAALDIKKVTSGYVRRSVFDD